MSYNVVCLHNNNIYWKNIVCYMFRVLVYNIHMLDPIKGLQNNIEYCLLCSP